MNTPYAITLELSQPLTQAVESLRAALMAEQMGIVSEVDVQATLKNKLGVDSHPQKLLGVCSPRVAHTLITAEPDIAALLPCGCSVSEVQAGHTRIAFQDPLLIAAASNNAAIHAAMAGAREGLLRVVQALGKA
jgi:uncharacterized protein (DUF302 family)